MWPLVIDPIVFNPHPFTLLEEEFGVNKEGKILYNFQDFSGQTNWLTSAVEHKGFLGWEVIKIM